MGFYGNITNTTSSQFTFDKIYPNRQAMDDSVRTDGVYVNRFVLIEYDVSLANALNNNMTKIQESDIKESDDGYEIQVNGKTIKYEDIKDDSRLSIVYTCVIDDTNPNFPVEKNHNFYGCEEEPNNDNLGNVAIYKLISQADNSGLNYITNYHTDQKKYGVSRGYDSTVWQKMYMDGTEKYVMIAELNSVVPTFDVSPDAPTMGPIVPHFDKSSTNVYYKLHWQAPWGFRVAGADNDLSDEQTVWYRDKYDSESGTTIREYYDKGTWRELTEKEVANKEFPQRTAAIYFNEAAFNKQLNESNIQKHNGFKDKNGNYINEIKIEPTGFSGNKYNKHDGTADLGEIADIQEMTIHLPAIGNMMSDAWDIIHGPARNNSKSQSLQGILDTFTEMGSNQIPYKRESNGEIVGADLTENDWIKATLDDTNQKINIVHKGSNNIEISDNPTPINFNNDGNQFSSYTLKETDKGHVKKVERTTITLPNGFNKIQTTDGSSLVEATTPRSAFKIATDDWIHVEKPEGTNDTLKLLHEAHTQQWEFKEINEENNETYFDFKTFDTVDDAGHMDYYYTERVYFPWSFSKVETDEEDSSVVAEAVNSTFKIGGDNTWTETEVDDNNNNKILVKHKAKEKAKKEKFTGLFTGGYNCIDVITDEAGHIVEYKNHSIPYGLVSADVYDKNDVLFQISCMSVKDPTKAAVKIYGDDFINLTGVTKTELSEDQKNIIYNTGFKIQHKTTDAAPSKATAVTTNKIYVNNVNWDSAGHIVGCDPKEYTLLTLKTPSSDSSITQNENDGSITIKGNTTIQYPNEDDTSVSVQTQWIDVSHQNDVIAIDHKNPNKTDINKVELGDSNSLTIPYLSHDSKGHVFNSGTKELIGDKWLAYEQKIVADEKDDTKQKNIITISHSPAQADNLTYAGRDLNVAEDQTFIFEPGDTIIVPYIGYDSKGHVYEIKEQQAKLPTKIGVAEVIIDDEQRTDENKNKLIMNAISVSEDSGHVIPWYTTTKNLLLNDYNTPLSDTGESSAQWMVNIGSGDSINSALGKLEYKINNLSNSGGGSANFTIAAPVIMSGDKALTSLSYINNQLVPCYTTTKSFKISGYYEREMDAMIDLTQPIGNDDTINTALRKLSHQITFRESGVITTVYDLKNQVEAMGPIRTDFNNLSNFVMFTLSKNVDKLEARIQALETALAVSQAEEILIDEDEIEQIANNLDNV